MDSMTTLLGGRRTDVLKNDGSTEEVMVRQLPVRLYPKLRDCLTDECSTIELYCDKPAGWADELTPASHEAVVSLADEINRDFFSRWLERQKARAALLPKADVAEVVAMFDALQKTNPALLDDVLKKAVGSSPSSLPKLRSTAG